jgi:hypothetical protein
MITDVECGVFVSMAAYCLFKGLSLNYDMSKAANFRVHMSCKVLDIEPPEFVVSIFSVQKECKYNAICITQFISYSHSKLLYEI